jgi:hypothetical protein
MKGERMKSRSVRSFGVAIALAILLSLCLPIVASALPSLVPFNPLYPPGPPYSRTGNGGIAPNMWGASGHGNPQYGQSGNIFWWQCPPQLLPG